MRKEISRMNYDLEEMLELRRQGWTTPALGARYGKDHTTILHHCRKHGVEPPARSGAATKQVIPGICAHCEKEIENHRRKKFCSRDCLIASFAKPVKWQPKIHVPSHKYIHIIDEPEQTRGHDYSWYLDQAKKRSIEADYFNNHRLVL